MHELQAQASHFLTRQLLYTFQRANKLEKLKDPLKNPVYIKVKNSFRMRPRPQYVGGI